MRLYGYLKKYSDSPNNQITESPSVTEPVDVPDLTKRLNKMSTHRLTVSPNHRSH